MTVRLKTGFRKLTASLAGAVVSAALAAPVAAESLADAMAGAYNHSGLLEQNRALLRAADEDTAIALAATRPILNWSADVTRSFGSSFTQGNVAATTANANLVAELLLYDFGASKLAIDAAKETVLATRQALIGAEQSVLLRAVTAFMNVRREAENVALRQNNVRLITKELRAARDRFDVGEVTRTDVSLAEARLAASRSALAGSQGGLAMAVQEYQAVVGRKPGNLVPPRHLPKTAKSMDAATAVALRTHPDMRKVQHEVTVAELNIKRAQAAMKPTVKLKGRLSVSETFNSPNYNNGGSIGVEASGPIYHGGRLSALARQAMARRDAVRAGLHITRHGVRQNVGNAWARLLVAQAARDASQRQIRASRVAFRGVREEATLGARTTLDVLNAEQELLNAQAGLISAIADEYIAAYSVLASMGLLTAEHLKLKVKRYDPAEYYNLIKSAPTVSKQGEKLDRVLRALQKD